MVRDVIKQNGKLYIEFNESIEGLNFAAQLRFKEVGDTFDNPFSPKILPDDNYEPKVVRRANQKVGNILEISLKNMKDNVEYVRLLALFVRNNERTYQYAFSTFGQNDDKANA